MNSNTLKIIAFILILAASAHSCEYLDYENSCPSGNCKAVTIKGSVRVLPSGEGLPDVPVTAETIRYSGTTIARKVGSGKTDKNGEFNFEGTIDKSIYIISNIFLQLNK